MGGRWEGEEELTRNRCDSLDRYGKLVENCRVHDSINILFARN